MPLVARLVPVLALALLAAPAASGDEAVELRGIYITPDGLPDELEATFRPDGEDGVLAGSHAELEHGGETPTGTFTLSP